MSPCGCGEKAMVYGCLWMFMDVYGCLWMLMDAYGCLWMFMDVYGCLWMFITNYSFYGVKLNINVRITLGGTILLFGFEGFCMFLFSEKALNGDFQVAKLHQGKAWVEFPSRGKRPKRSSPCADD